MSKRSEREIQDAIMMEASQLGATVWRNNTGMLYNRRGTPVKYGLCKGSSDIIGIWQGRFLAIEVKRPNKKATKDQQRFIDHVNAKGGIAFVCDDEKKLKEMLYM